jgi:glutamate dehydrogenase/leucine dehydrogenase
MIRNHREFDNHEFVIALTDKPTNLKAFIAIHDRNLGFAHGGTRMKVYDDEDQALSDVLDLSKAMSYKSALAGLPYGGGKGVIMLPVDVTEQQRAAILTAYAQKIETLQGLFHTGSDVGVTDEDTKLMAKSCQYILGVSDVALQSYTTGKMAALGVYYAIKAAAVFKYGSDDLKGKTVSVKGLGKLGGELVELLHKDGAILYVADLDAAKAQAIHDKYPVVTPVDTYELHKQKVDIYAPCALGHDLTSGLISELSCDIVCGGANNQLESKEAADELVVKNILYIPDYVANAGGLIFVSDELEFDGFHIERVMQRTIGIGDTLQTIFERSMQENVPVYQIADTIARERIGRE